MAGHPLALLIPIIALLIPVAAIVMSGLTKVAVARYRALGAGSGAGGDTADRLDALEQEVLTLRHELADAQERLDFTERLLTRTDSPPTPRQLP